MAFDQPAGRIGRRLRGGQLGCWEHPVHRLARQAPQPEAPNPTQQLAVGMPDQVGLDLGRLQVGLQPHLAAESLGPFPWGEGQGLQAHGQEQLAAGGLRIQAGRHQLEAAVQQAFGAATGGAPEFSPGLALLALQLVEGPKAGAIGQAAAG